MSAKIIYREALESIAKNTCCSDCIEAAVVAKSALKLAESGQTAPNTARDEIAAAEMLCKIYFDIAASCIGEDALRQRVAAATSPVA